jgi:hypothetical protein
MALIWRSIFNVGALDSEARGASLVADWLRWKLKDPGLELPLDGSVLADPSGWEITGRLGRQDATWVLRARLFERSGDQELRTTVTFHSQWAWIDLERWSTDAFVESWVPIAPGIVRTILHAGDCGRGPTALPAKPQLLNAQDGGALAEQLLAPDREIPVVLVSPTRDELEGDIQPAIARAIEVQRRLHGIAPVVILGHGAVTSFSQSMHERLGDGFDVYGGAIRTYLPGLDEDDWPGRHRFVAFSRFRARPFNITADIVAAAIQRGACAQPPPSEWRQSLQKLIEPVDSVGDDEFLHEMEAELARVERQRDQERSSRVRAEQALEAERDAAADTETENDDLRRRIAYLETELKKRGTPAGPTPVQDDFEPDFCAEIPIETAERLSHVIFPESQWDDADDLDRHMSAAWAKRSWRAMIALETYAQAKLDGDFSGNFRDYCQQGGQHAIPPKMLTLKESETTDNNSRFRQLRTLPIDPAVCGETQIYMPAHVKIVPGGSPAPRIHFYDDTSGSTGKVHIGYFGDHLNNKGKS